MPMLRLDLDIVKATLDERFEEEAIRNDLSVEKLPMVQASASVSNCIEESPAPLLLPMVVRPFESIWKTVEVAKAELEVLTRKSGTVPPAAPATESLAAGVDVPIPTLPLLRIVKADGSDEVANVELEEVARYKLPPAFRKDQWGLVRTLGSESESCTPVEDAT